MRRTIVLGLAVLVTSLATLATTAGTAGAAAPRVQTGGFNAITYGSDNYCGIVFAGSEGFINSPPGVATDPADYVDGRYGWQSCRTDLGILGVQAQLSLQNTTNGQSFTQTVFESFAFGPTSWCDNQAPGPPWTYGYSCVSTSTVITCLPRSGSSYWYAGMSYRYYLDGGVYTGWKPMNDWQTHHCRP